MFLVEGTITECPSCACSGIVVDSKNQEYINLVKEYDNPIWFDDNENEWVCSECMWDNQSL